MFSLGAPSENMAARRADADGVDVAVVERDYVLAHVVAQIHRVRPSDGGRLVFKGGTAIRFVYLPGYRYSADLDFTVIGGGAVAATGALVEALDAVRRHAGLPHLELAGGDKPAISYIGPLGAASPRQIKLDLATDEHVERVEEHTLLDLWPDLPKRVAVAVYSIEEIAAEKTRCVIQRVQCRDLYDLFRLTADTAVSLEGVRPLFDRKAEAKRLDPGSFAQRFEDRLQRYGQRWSTEMAEHLANPPRFADVVRIVRRQLRKAGLLET
jgi:predicted nucleotidyltransferase component of viral defense system